MTYAQLLEAAKKAEEAKTALVAKGLSPEDAEKALDVLGVFGPASASPDRKAERKAAKAAAKATYTVKIPERELKMLEADFAKAEDAYKLGKPLAYRELEAAIGVHVTGWTLRRILRSIKNPGMTNQETADKIIAHYSAKPILHKAGEVAASPKL